MIRPRTEAAKAMTTALAAGVSLKWTAGALASTTGVSVRDAGLFLERMQAAFVVDPVPGTLDEYQVSEHGRNVLTDWMERNAG